MAGLELHTRIEGPRATDLAAGMAGLGEMLAADLAGLTALVEKERRAGPTAPGWF